MIKVNRRGIKSGRGDAPVRARCLVGTSGWNYEHWSGGVFYPAGMKRPDWFAYYCRHFRSVEINNSFYRLPEKRVFQNWYEAAPPGFIFAVKASRFITHNKKLKDPESTLEALLTRITVLGPQLGPILFQLPPRWHFNAERLTAFLEALPARHRYAMEFRDRSWINEEALAILNKFNVAFCIYEFDYYLSPQEVTADFVYIRLHGPQGRYQGQYRDQALSGWAGAIATWGGQGKNVFCYFDNDEAGYAAADAARLQEMLASG